MVSRGSLGIGYLFATGAVLLVGYLGILLRSRFATPLAAIATILGLALSVALLATAFQFRARAIDAAPWRLAKWCSAGLALATLFTLLVLAARASVPDTLLVPGLLINYIAAGGLFGVLAGSTNELKTHHDEVRTLNHRNTVMNRVLRHNIRNDMNLILGHAQIIEDQATDAPTDSLTAIKRKATDVVGLSKAARHVEALDATPNEHPIDLTATLRAQLDQATVAYPDATYDLTLECQQPVRVHPLVEPVLDNLIENAIEHNDTTPHLDVSVTPEREGGGVAVAVADNGPGLPDQQRRVLETDHETPKSHGNGLGLWLVKWFLDHQGGGLEFRDNHPRGTVVEIEIPTADARRPDSGSVRGGAAPASRA